MAELAICEVPTAPAAILILVMASLAICRVPIAPSAIARVVVASLAIRRVSTISSASCRVVMALLAICRAVYSIIGYLWSINRIISDFLISYGIGTYFNISYSM